jgi:hypothetical protein
MLARAAFVCFLRSRGWLLAAFVLAAACTEEPVKQAAVKIEPAKKEETLSNLSRRLELAVPDKPRDPPAKKRPGIDRVPDHDAMIEIFVIHGDKLCTQLERHLVERKVRYRRWDIQSDPRARQYYKSLGVDGVPIIKIGRKVVRGLDIPTLDAAIKTLGEDPNEDYRF